MGLLDGSFTGVDWNLDGVKDGWDDALFMMIADMLLEGATGESSITEPADGRCSGILASESGMDNVNTPGEQG